MCGRYVLARPVDELVEYFGVEAVEADWSASYNVAPTRTIPVVAVSSDPPVRKLAPFRWGLVPFWAESPVIGTRFINARAESVATLRAFRDSFASRRCLVPADGFYEWEPAAKTGPRQPWYFAAVDGEPLALAGLFDRWRDKDGSWLLSCTIITTDANKDVANVHDRMPVLVRRDDFATWLERRPLAGDAAERLLRGLEPGALVTRRAAPAVGNVNNDGPELLESA